MKNICTIDSRDEWQRLLFVSCLMNRWYIDGAMYIFAVAAVSPQRSDTAFHVFQNLHDRFFIYATILCSSCTVWILLSPPFFSIHTFFYIGKCIIMFMAFFRHERVVETSLRAFLLKFSSVGSHVAQILQNWTASSAIFVCLVFHVARGRSYLPTPRVRKLCHIEPQTLTSFCSGCDSSLQPWAQYNTSSHTRPSPLSYTTL